jgi:hypothetical protein
VDNKKVAFTFYARVISSIYPLEGALHKFLRSAEWNVATQQEKIISAMKGLFDEKTNKRQIVRYLPLAMRGLFQHLTSGNAVVAREGFDILLNILAAFVIASIHTCRCNDENSNFFFSKNKK